MSGLQLRTLVTRLLTPLRCPSTSNATRVAHRALVMSTGQRFFASTPALTPSGDKWLLTPGPLTTELSTKEAMLHDYGSRDIKFIEMNRRIRSKLVDLCTTKEKRDLYTCVPMQGSGTFAVESTLRSLIPRDTSHLLLHADGVYGVRMASICTQAGITHTAVADYDDFMNKLKTGDYTHAAVVHCETSTGRLLPLEPVASVANGNGTKLIVDAMSSFGALEIDASALNLSAVIASSNKCLEGVPGMGFAVVKKDDLTSCPIGTAGSLSLDMHDQYTGLEKTSQYRFTPATHCLVALDHAIALHEEQGGVRGRGDRYRANHKILTEGMSKIGFEMYLPLQEQAPIIVTFLSPRDPKFNFEQMYNSLAERGYVIYPGKLTDRDTFRIGCIGSMRTEQMTAAIAAIREVCVEEIGVTDFTPN